MSTDVYRKAAQASPVEHELSCANCGKTDIRFHEAGPWCVHCGEFWAARSPEQRASPGPLGDYLTFGPAPEYTYQCSVLWRTGRVRRNQADAWEKPK